MTVFAEFLMANGTSVPISEVRVGDEVLATDAATGATSGRTVTDTQVMLHDGDLLDLTIEDDDGQGIIQTTDNHPFWSETDQAWERAIDLSEGEQLRQHDGTTATVLKLTERPGRQDMHDLTVEVEHNFYVDFGNGAVLVHNQTSPDFEFGVFIEEHGVKIKVNSGDYNGRPDHGPAHAHVQSPGMQDAKIGQNGHILDGSRDLTANERAVVDRNSAKIRSHLDKFLRWYRFNIKGC